MKITRALSLVACLQFFLPASAAELPPKIRLLIENLTADSKKDSLWPGYNPLLVPVLVHVKGEGSYLINAPAAPKGYVALKGFSKPVYFGRNAQADNVFAVYIPHYDVPDAGKVFFYNCGGDSLLSAEKTILHETFHVFQETASSSRGQSTSAVAADGFIAGYAADFRLVWNWARDWLSKKTSRGASADINELAVGYTENKLLALALLEERDYKIPAAKFIRIREHRRAMLSSSRLDYERGQERTEGTAHYVGWQGAAGLSKALAEYYNAGLLLSPDLTGDGDSKFYVRSAAQGFLLDRAGVKWQPRVQNGEDIYDIMKEVFSPGLQTPDAKTILRELDCGDIRKTLEVKMETERSERLRALTELKNYEGWKLVVHNNLGCGIASASSGEAISVREGSYYPKLEYCEAICPELHLLITHAALMQSGGDITVFLGEKPDFSVAINGAEIPTLPDSADFNVLDIKTDLLSLNLSRPGRLITRKKTIEIEPIGKAAK